MLEKLLKCFMSKRHILSWGFVQLDVFQSKYNIFFINTWVTIAFDAVGNTKDICWVYAMETLRK